MFNRPFLSLCVCLLLAAVVAGGTYFWDRQSGEAALRAASLEKLNLVAQRLEADINRHRAEVGILSRTAEARFLVATSPKPARVAGWLKQNMALTTANTLAFYRFEDDRQVELGRVGQAVPSARIRRVLQNSRQGRLGRAWFLTGDEPSYVFASPVSVAGRVQGALVLAVALGPIRDRFSLEPARLSVVGNDGGLVFSNITWVTTPNRPADRVFEKPMRLFDWKIILRDSYARETLVIRQRAALVFLITGLLLGAVAFAGHRRRSLLSALQREQQQAAELDRLVQQRTLQLEKAQKELVQKEKLAAFGTTYPSISHEISQPIMALKTYSQNGRKLLEKGRTAEAVENFQAILRLTERMDRIVANLRAFARGDHTDTRAVDMQQTISSVAEEVAQSTGPGFRDSLSITTTGEGPFLADAGDVRAHQVMLNLLMNAARAVRDQAQPKIAITLEATDLRIIIDVRDSGPGVPPEMSDDIFEHFVTTRNKGGLGLGLSISRAFVDLMGGTLELLPSERVDQGAHFRMTLKRWKP
jgi:C4-dicarboxylate-specific signal transduction histidine kinase